MELPTEEAGFHEMNDGYVSDSEVVSHVRNVLKLVSQVRVRISKQCDLYLFLCKCLANSTVKPCHLFLEKRKKKFFLEANCSKIRKGQVSF